MLINRTSGILLHVTSLPSDYGVGDMGFGAYKFMDFLVNARQGIWQVLPLNPTSANRYHSPYEPVSAFAGNNLLISPDLLYRDGLLTSQELEEARLPENDCVNYEMITNTKNELFDFAFNRFARSHPPENYIQFCKTQKDWLENYAFFAALRRSKPRSVWWRFNPEGSGEDVKELSGQKNELKDAIEREKFLQFCFWDQWMRLKHYANKKGVILGGDIPFYMGRDNADVWQQPDIFKLTSAKEPACVGGVPPDRFSATGQLWGSPVYDWQRLKQTNYSWWIQRLQHNLKLFDIIRIDHFRGFAGYWEIPADSKDATSGHWQNGPGSAFLKEVFRYIPFAPIIAEDLGTITPDVRELIRNFDLPGMAVLQFAFDTDNGISEHALHNHLRNQVFYTGTHDTNTLRGWFANELDEGAKARVFKYLGCSATPEDIVGKLLRLAMMSVCRMLIIPMQDVLGLDSHARMNYPGQSVDSWKWRMMSSQLSTEKAQSLAELTAMYGRCSELAQ